MGWNVTVQRGKKRGVTGGSCPLKSFTERKVRGEKALTAQRKREGGGEWGIWVNGQRRGGATWGRGEIGKGVRGGTIPYVQEERAKRTG